MDRRQAINTVALLLGGTVIGAEFFISGCKPSSTNAVSVDDLFKPDQVAFMDEISETILPATKTPGAKAAGVGNFMAIMVRDCYEPADQQIFIDGFAKIDGASQQKFNKNFMDCDAGQRTEVLTNIDAAEKACSKTKKEADPKHYFRLMKELTLLGYFTSEVGCTQALRYLAVPGRFDGDYPYKKGDKAWAMA